MYLSTYFCLLVALLLIESTHGCSIDCGDECACVAPDGLGSDCSGFRGCHKECPPRTSILGCNRSLANHTGAGNEFSDNSDEQKIKLNIEINLNGIKSYDMGLNNITPFSKVLTSSARKIEGHDIRQKDSCGRSKIRKGKSNGYRSGIIGGNEIKPHSEPWLAILWLAKKNRWAGCGATLISSTFALTAAHCDGAGYRQREAQADTLKLGAHNKKNDEGSEVYVPISKWHTHPNAFDFTNKKKYGGWLTTVLWWDYSLLQLGKNVKFTNHIQPACLPSMPYQDYSGKDVFASGWGQTDPNDKFSWSDVPKSVLLRVVSTNPCKQHFWKAGCEKHCKKEYVICTYGTKDAFVNDNKFVEDACGGDSGDL